MSAPTGNQNAAKPEAERLSAPTCVKSTKAERKAWLKAAAGGRLNTWIRRHLNRAAGLPDE